MIGGIASIGVVHIALSAYGVQPFRDFLRSYRAHSAGRDHDLIVVLKGFDGPDQTAPFLVELGSLPCTVEHHPDGGFDIGTYYAVMLTHVRDAYCLFNSRSRLLAEDWLAKLVAPITDPRIGVAGATASYESLLTDHLRASAAVPTHALDWRAAVRQAIRRSPANHLRHWWRYPPFPNPHLRTNAFAIRRAVALAFPPGSTATRARTAGFENGRHNLTRRLARAGLEAVTVGRSGRCYTVDAWPASNGFWQDDQDDLLVADNQTDRYFRADAEERRALRFAAWGDVV